jgi:hypothetical protein
MLCSVNSTAMPRLDQLPGQRHQLMALRQPYRGGGLSISSCGLEAMAMASSTRFIIPIGQHAQGRSGLGLHAHLFQQRQRVVPPVFAALRQKDHSWRSADSAICTFSTTVRGQKRLAIEGGPRRCQIWRGARPTSLAQPDGQSPRRPVTVEQLKVVDARAIRPIMASSSPEASSKLTPSTARTPPNDSGCR